MQAVQSQINIFFFSVYQSLATHIFEYFVRAHVFWSVSVDVAFYLRGYQRNALFLRPDESGFNTGMMFSGMYIS